MRTASGCGICIGKVYKVRIIDVSLVNVIAHVFNELIVVHIELAVGSAFQQVEALVKRCSCPAPVTRTFIATAIIRINIHKFVERTNHFLHPFNFLLLIFFQNQNGSEYVMVCPGIPVVHVPRTIQTLPPEIIALVIWNDGFFHDFVFQPFCNKRVNFVEFLFKQKPGPRKDVGNFTHTQVDHRFISIGQPVRRLLRGEVCRPSPPGLFAVIPGAVHNLVSKPAFAFG